MDWPADGKEAREGVSQVAWSEDLRQALDLAPLAQEGSMAPWRWEEAGPWDAGRMGAPRWVASWDPQGWEEPCLRLSCFDFALAGRPAFEWVRLGGRAFIRVGSGIMRDEDEVGGCPPAFVAEYRVAREREWPGPWQSVRGLDLDGPARVLAISEALDLDRASREMAKKTGPRL